MAHRYSILLLWMPSSAVEQLQAIQLQIQQEAGLNPDYLSLSIWQDCDFPEKYAVVLHESLGEPDLYATLLEPQIARMVDNLLAPPTVHKVLVRHSAGQHPGDIQPGQLMSMSVREAEPGYFEDLLAEVSDIFEAIQYVPGYLGSVYGQNVSLEDEVIGIVYWQHRQGFEESMPRGSFYEIRLYERIS
ncbi:MAG: hypothetical protein JNM04_03645 [Chthonomonas sp.]|nr:hypothetical protein [Chthonomonas sp.]